MTLMTAINNVFNRSRSVGASSGFNDAAITSRSPKLYLKLEESSGTPADTAGASYGGTISVSGSPQYHFLTTHGFGIRLGTGAYIQATHDSVFTTSGGDGPFGTAGVYLGHGVVESEVTVTVHVAFPTTLQDDWIIWSKAPTTAENTTLTPHCSLRVHSDGSLELRIREWKYRVDTRMRTAPGVVSQGGEATITASFGYEGMWFSVNGRQANFGFKNTRAWWGWDHRHNAVESGGTAGTTRTTNTANFRLGRGFDQTSSADIVVTKFAVFYSGATRITRGQVTPGFTLAAHQSIAGASGTALVAAEFPTAGNQAASPGTNTLATAINAANAAGGGTVTLAAGTYNQTVDLVLPSRVRLTCASGTAIISLASTATLRTANPTMLSATALQQGALTSGDATYTAANTLSNDAVFLIAKANVASPPPLVNDFPNALGYQYLAAGQAPPHDVAFTQCDFIPIRTRTASVITFARAPYWTYPTPVTTTPVTSRRSCTTAMTPSAVDIAIDGNIIIRKNGGTGTDPLLASAVRFEGARRVRLSNITIEQLDTTANNACLACSFNGCVEVDIQGCTITTTSPDNTVTNQHHPYALAMSACAHYSVFNHIGHSNEWHSMDNAAGNPNADTWGLGSSTPGVQWGGQFGDVRKFTGSTLDTLAGNNFVLVAHISQFITVLDLLGTTGGGVSIDGWGHDWKCMTFQPASTRATQIAHTRGVGGLMLAHGQFNNGLGNWANGAKGHGDCTYVNLHFVDATPTASFSYVPDAGGNTYIDVDTSTRSGAQWPPASPLP